MAAVLATVAAQAEPAQSGILTYDAAFFAEARPNTAYDMIKRLPGFNFDAGATARGFAGTAGNVLIDGQRPTTKSDALDSVLQRIPAADVDHVELIRGGAPGIDMQGQTVVANVIRKKEDSTRIVATAEDSIFTDGHMIPYASLEFTQHSGQSTYEGSAGLIQNYDDSVGKGYHNVYDGAGNLLTHDVAYSRGLGVGGSVKGAATFPLPGGEFKINGLLLISPFVDDLRYQRPGFTEDFHDDSREGRAELGLHWKGLVGGMELETLVLQRLGHSTARSTADDGATFQDFGSRSDTGETIARATLRYRPTPDLTFEGGAEGAYNFLDGRTRFAINAVDQPLPSADARVEERRGEAFAQGTWRISEQWMFEAGARAEYSTISESGSVDLSRSFFYPKPRAVLTWSPGKDTQVRLRYEKVVGQLDFTNFIASANLSATGVTVGNQNLRPDQHAQYEISLEQHFWDKGAVVLGFMHEDIKDVVDYVPIADPLGNVFDAPGNIGNGRNEHITLNVTLPLDRIGLTNGLLVTTAIWDVSSVRDPVSGMDRWISGQRPNNINIKLSQDVDSLKSTWGVSYYNCWDEQYYRLAQVRYRHVAAPYVVLFWEWKPDPEWSLHVEADNVWGFVYTDTNIAYSGPRNVSPIADIDKYVAQSRPYVDIQLRHTL